jgi:hypothetical protein
VDGFVSAPTVNKSKQIEKKTPTVFAAVIRIFSLATIACETFVTSAIRTHGNTHKSLTAIGKFRAAIASDGC